MKEQKIAQIITDRMPENPWRKTKLNHCDAEYIKGEGIDLLITTDEFSAEDLFREHNPFTLGWNIAAASISDIYAAGGTPFQYSHAMKIPANWDETYISEFSKGISAVLQESGTGFIGGDLSQGKTWSYTATVIGRPLSTPVLRSGIQAGDKIYISGKIGAGNFEAALELYKTHPLLGRLAKWIPNRFPLRHKESALLTSYARACIDTSDGVFSSLNTLADINGLGYKINNLPLKTLPAVLSKLVKKPELLLFLGGAGEYELLTAVPEHLEEAFVKDARKSGLIFYPLGEFSNDPGRYVKHKDTFINLQSFIIDNRDFNNPADILSFFIGEINNGI